MGKIINFKDRTENNVGQEKKKGSRWKRFLDILMIVAAVCGVLGFTARDVYHKTVGRDWQKMAEEYNNEGLNCFNHGDYDQAIELYTKAIDLEKKGIDDIEVCYYNRGRAYYKQGDNKKAIGDFTQAISIKPKSKYYFDRAEAYEAAGEAENALNDRLKGAVSLND